MYSLRRRFRQRQPVRAKHRHMFRIADRQLPCRHNLRQVDRRNQHTFANRARDRETTLAVTECACHPAAACVRHRDFEIRRFIEKCEFGRRSVHFLGHVISNDGIAMDKSKVNAINQWPTPKSVDDVRSFVGLAGYYRKYVHGFGQIAAPLFDLLKKEVRFVWTAAAQKAASAGTILYFADFCSPAS